MELHQTGVGDLPRQPSSLTFFFLLQYAASPATSREVCLWSVRRENLGTGEDVGVERIVALIQFEEFTSTFKYTFLGRRANQVGLHLSRRHRHQNYCHDFISSCHQVPTIL